MHPHHLHTRSAVLLPRIPCPADAKQITGVHCLTGMQCQQLRLFYPADVRHALSLLILGASALRWQVTHNCGQMKRISAAALTVCSLRRQSHPACLSEIL